MDIFLLSAFLFAQGAMQGRYGIFDEKGRIVWKQLGKFYLSRFLRFALIYYLYLILFELFTNGGFLVSNPNTSWKVLLFVFDGNGGVLGIGHLWYVSVAMQIYLIMPFCYWLIQFVMRKKPIFAALLFLVALTAGLVWRLIALTTSIDWYTWVYTFFASNLDIVLCGLLGAHLVKYIRQNLANKITSVAAFVCLIVFNVYIYSLNYLDIYRGILPSVYIVVCLYLIGSFRVKERGKTFFSYMGSVSYGFYVFHILALQLANTIFLRFSSADNPILAAFIIYGLAFLFATSISHFFTFWIVPPWRKKGALK